jgi:hypothetical protein
MEHKATAGYFDNFFNGQDRVEMPIKFIVVLALIVFLGAFTIWVIPAIPAPHV